MQRAVDELLHADIPYRIRIGIVGARTVPDPAQLSAQIDVLVNATITPCSLGERLSRRRKPPQRIADLFASSHAHAGGAWLHSALCLAALVLPAVGASLGGIRSHREYSRMEKRSAGMVEQLTELKDDFAEVDTPQAFELLLAETEELMLREAQDWLLLMGTAKLEAA